MTKLTTRILPLGVMLAVISGCTSVTSNLAPEMKTARSDRVYACHGFNCTFKTRVDITSADADAFASFFANADSPAAEREGIAYRVVAADAAVTLAYLRAREQVNGVYREARVRVDIHGEPGRSEVAVAYIVERAHPSYAGRLPLAVQARIIRGGKGLSGVNLDYVINTLSHMGQIGIRERELERLLTVLGGYFARGGSVNHVSRRAEILRRAVSHQRVTHRCARPMRPAERRRFMHRMSNRAR